MTLDEVRVGSTVRVKKVYGDGPLRRRVMDMGLIHGVEVKVEKIAPLGDPIELTLRGYQLSIRMADAKNVEVE